jgi:hypothetical protein
LHASSVDLKTLDPTRRPPKILSCYNTAHAAGHQCGEQPLRSNIILPSRFVAGDEETAAEVCRTKGATSVVVAKGSSAVEGYYHFLRHCRGTTRLIPPGPLELEYKYRPSL